MAVDDEPGPFDPGAGPGTGPSVGTPAEGTPPEGGTAEGLVAAKTVPVSWARVGLVVASRVTVMPPPAHDAGPGSP